MSKNAQSIVFNNAVITEKIAGWLVELQRNNMGDVAITAIQKISDKLIELGSGLANNPQGTEILNLLGDLSFMRHIFADIVDIEHTKTDR